MPPYSQRPVVLAASAALLSLGVREDLEKCAELRLDPSGPDDFIDADAVIASWHLQLTSADISAARNLSVITHLGTGVHVDVDAATEFDIPVFINPGYQAIAVAEHTIALMLASVKRIVQSDVTVRSRADWKLLAPELVTEELHGKTLGVVGFGHIGQAVAKIARDGFGMRVIGNDAQAGLVNELGFAEREIDDLMRQADILTVHAALTRQSHHLIDKRRLALLKPGSYVVNTARAEVVDYRAMAELLSSGHIAGAAVDTWPGHRGDPRSYLLDVPRLVISQHNAGLTRESVERTRNAALDGLWEVLAGTLPSGSRIINDAVWSRRRTPRSGLEIPRSIHT